MRTNGNFSFRRALKEYYDYSLISTCKGSSWYFWETPYKARERYTVTESLDIIVSVK
jgi:hypothetical protein